MESIKESGSAPSILHQEAGEPGPGFKFIVTTPSQRRSRDNQRLVRSHATRARPRRKGCHPLPSWINQGADDDQGSQAKQHAGSYPVPSQSQMKFPSPSRVGSELAWIQFPEFIKPYMLEGIIRFVRNGLYPAELCFEVESFDSGWVGCLMSDPVYLHSMLFSSEAYVDDCLGRDHSPVTQFHFLKTLRLLQERIAVPDDPLAIADQTIMTVVTLALAAQVFGDRATVENHVRGLEKMVSLRGGLGLLKTSTHELPAKICRVDLGFALTFGHRPAFFRQAISWDRYVVDHRKSRPAHLDCEDDTSAFIQALDWRLANVWKDLQRFSDICNLACQTGHRLTHTSFSEIMISVLYRLLHISLGDCPLAECLRVGMLAFAATIFMQWQYFKLGQGSLAEMFSAALLRLQISSVDVPPAVLFWLLTVMNTSFSNDAEAQHVGWLEEVIGLVRLASWDEARKVLKSMVWIDSLNDSKGKAAFVRAKSNIDWIPKYGEMQG
ncbi:hypothetical protein AK830_g10602 [Neonectria ditissima]|uniref:Transcription factor domain-containing protein n=1 Tax=Neonectria ditissima TaxID=78410 RepID=A0A0P7AFE3_9HYPO|nr:hypothetical protein AK830_g10602 [Neonectria ditissima]